MSILDLHDPGAALPRYIAPPKTRPEPKFSAWLPAIGDQTAPFRGFGAAFAEGSASLLEALEPFGATVGRMYGETPEPGFGRKMAEDVRVGWSKNMAPSATDASESEQILYQFARGATKIMVGSALAGPAGVVAMGGEEAVTQTRELQRKGVDDATAWKAGGVQGAGLALAALPLLGKTLTQTAALYVAGGPGGFMAQQALTREILQAGGYDQIAAQYDPFDPVGLAVSSLIPAVFTAAGIRSQRKAAVQREVADAARVALQAEQRRMSNPAPDAPRSADLHEAALVKAEDAIARGEPVAVADVAAVPPSVDVAAVAAQRSAVEAIDAQIARTEAEIADGLATAGDLADRGAVRTAREELRLMEQTRVDTSDAAIRAVAKDIQSRDGISYKAALSKATKQVEDAAKDWQSRQERLIAFVERNAAAQQATQRVGQLEADLAALKAQRHQESSRLDAMTSRPVQALGAAVDQLRAAMDEVNGRAEPPAVAKPEPAAPAPDNVRPDAIIELRKRASVLRSLKECLAS